MILVTEKLDLLIVPGGWGTRKEVKNDNLVKWIAGRSADTQITASIYTGSSLLGKSGITRWTRIYHPFPSL